MRAVVDDLRRTHGSAGLGVVQTYPVAAAGHIAGVNAVAAQRIHGNLADFVLGKFGNKKGIMAIVSQGNSDVGFTTARDDTKTLALNEAAIPLRGQAKHDFA